ncbi:glutamate--tRNA ligase [Candidatus Uhrbacteria bacterium]|nr:glutamate--tRNA ligase [Candidatus Uhrbacteria bacterium]
MSVRTRFAPSPTGELHLGGLRTALYAFLHARRHGGVFFIRIEDTDRARLVPGAQERLLTTLRTFGIMWDEGPDIGGPYGPYVQSERIAQYRDAAALLVEQGSAYRCDCTPVRLQELRDAQTAARQPTRYDAHCRDRSDVDPQAPHVVRFRMPEQERITVADVIHGDITVNAATLDDFVLLKSDGWPTYHLAHVVDDHAMRTTDVIRGDEWLSSLPKHALLFRAFQWEVPRYAHLPLLLNAQRKKLSKRDGDTDVASFLSWCFPDALRNFVALLGWNPSADREQFTLEELVAAFDVAAVHASPAVVDFAKLEWLNGVYIRAMPEEELRRIIRTQVPSAAGYDDAFVDRAITLERSRLRRLDAFPAWYFAPYAREAPLPWKGTSATVTKQNLEQLVAFLTSLPVWPERPAVFEAAVKPWLTAAGLGVGETLWPMRVALSGQQASPSPFELAWLFGRDETLNRLRYAIASL